MTPSGGASSRASGSATRILDYSEAIAAELLRRARAMPGSPVVLVALALGHEVVARHLPPGIRGASARGCRWIFLSPSGYLARDEFTVAHELMELYAPRSVLGLPDVLKEKFCDRGAAAMLLPREAFLWSLDVHGWDVATQRRLWPRASAKAIEARIGEVR